MKAPELTPQQLAGGGIYLRTLPRHQPGEYHCALPPDSLHNQYQLGSVIDVSRLALGFIRDLYPSPEAARDKRGMVLRFMTDLQVDEEADTFAPSPVSEIITAVRQPGHKRIAVAKREQVSPGVFSEQRKDVAFEPREVREDIMKPLSDNLQLLTQLHAAAEPTALLQSLQARVAELEATQNVAPARTRTVLSLGGFSLSIQRTAR
jgi:hypothetical protein